MNRWVKASSRESVAERFVAVGGWEVRRVRVRRVVWFFREVRALGKESGGDGER